MKIRNDALKEIMFEETYRFCLKKEFSTHEKSEYDICVLEKILLLGTSDQNRPQQSLPKKID